MWLRRQNAYLTCTNPGLILNNTYHWAQWHMPVNPILGKGRDDMGIFTSWDWE